jgi:hypothetical protein
MVAPILAGFAFAILVLVLVPPGKTEADPLRWRDPVLALLVFAALLLIISTQAAIRARAYLVKPDELCAWYPRSVEPRVTSDLIIRPGLEMMPLTECPQGRSPEFPTRLAPSYYGWLRTVTDRVGVSWWFFDARGGGRDEPGDEGDGLAAVRAGRPGCEGALRRRRGRGRRAGFGRRCDAGRGAGGRAASRAGSWRSRCRLRGLRRAWCHWCLQRVLHVQDGVHASRRTAVRYRIVRRGIESAAYPSRDEAPDAVDIAYDPEVRLRHILGKLRRRAR